MFQQVIHETPKGTIYIEGPCPGSYLADLTMNSKLTNFRPPEKQKKALIAITGMPHGMIYIARHEKEIVGYITFHRPDESSRWIKHPRVLELGGIEISSDWRRCKIAENILKAGFSNPVMEDYIVITMEMCWHWDTRNTKLDIWAYQKVLCNLFGSVGMKRTATDDPDILEHPANVLMARIGQNVAVSDVALFESMRFQNRYGNAVNLL
ncbi:GNAT family N-acetyltransferase [Desulfallas thermosapovorans]|uniref:Acetoin utilization protein AcuA n=1 Tax=Desulfallas thermosapovorans DSM 6562 TaxID=1121431 RepID=A0A5S4ZRW7_9FIRM|nr:GNAT family N-acetyltransferase [Desulfallas thermosapovorans]TYO94762.1 acetoin utilization protein AcuA [Desulfallas thermosapovorans DSM 6562]